MSCWSCIYASRKYVLKHKRCGNKHDEAGDDNAEDIGAGGRDGDGNEVAGPDARIAAGEDEATAPDEGGVLVTAFGRRSDGLLPDRNVHFAGSSGDGDTSEEEKKGSQMSIADPGVVAAESEDGILGWGEADRRGDSDAWDVKAVGDDTSAGDDPDDSAEEDYDIGDKAEAAHYTVMKMKAKNYNNKNLLAADDDALRGDP